MKAISPLMALGCGLVLCFSASAMSQTTQEVEPVYTNKSRFRIPFRYDAAEMQRIGAKEIRLYLSTDQGQSWRLSRQSNPQAGRFDFEAPAPGEYWFAVRTLDGQNQLYPPSKVLSAGLKVIVDNTPPTLKVDLAQAEPGKVKLSWQSSDPYLNLDTLRLEYIQAGSDRWQQVSVIPQAKGQTAWSVPQGGFVAVRGQIFDMAGNMQQTQSQVRLQPAAAVPNLNDTIAAPNTNNTVADQSKDALPPIVPNPFRQAPVIQPGNPGSGSQPAFNNTQPPSNFISNAPDNTPNVLAEPQDKQPIKNRPPRLSKNTRIVNSRKFQIGYKVEDVGPSGVGDVEMFITEDDGAKWFKYGNDLDRKSPFVVDTPRDGIYGFALRVHSGAGLAGDPPKPGEKPSIVVIVDSTPPSTQFLTADQGQGKGLNQVKIRWSYSDEYPSETPISLSYADAPNGVWNPVSGWIADTGEYTWNAGPNAPSQLYFRVTARDAAGNESRSQSTQPVMVDLRKPSATFMDVQSVEITPIIPRRN